MYRIDPAAEFQEQFSRSVQLASVQEVLSDQEIELVCRTLGYTWRDRIFPPSVTVRSMIFRSLHPNRSIRMMLKDLFALDDRLQTIPAGASWCEARSRLPEELWDRLIDRSTERLNSLAPNPRRYHGRAVYIGDGSTLSMPDEPELVEAFGYADTKHGPSRFPVLRITFVTHAGSQAACAYRLGPYRTGEDAQLHAIWHKIPSGAIFLCDRKFSSFYNLSKLGQRDIGAISELHQRRDPQKLIAAGRKIGRDEWIVPLDLAPQLRKRYADPSLPEELPVRLIRVRYRHGKKRCEKWLVTTLLDRNGYSRASIIRLYRRRWGIETRIGSLKTTLEISVLRSKTVKGIEYEVAATVLAHNVVWTLIHQAAKQTHTPADRISFLGAIDTIVAFSPRLRMASPVERDGLYQRMLNDIGNDINPYRPDRVEPRLVKRDRRRYGFLKVPREQARQECLS